MVASTPATCLSEQSKERGDAAVRITYVGDLSIGSTSLMRLRALQALGHETEGVDTACRYYGLKGLMERAILRTGWHPDSSGTNHKLLDAVRRSRPDLIWVDKGLSIAPATLIEIRKLSIKLVHYSPDDMSGRHNQTWQYLKCIPLYDLHVTTKSFNVSELKQKGARSVVFVNNAHCSKTHRPIDITVVEQRLLGGPVGFIGGFEQARANSIKFLVANGIPVRVWGGGWEAWAKVNQSAALRIECRCLWAEDYVKAICSFDINLGFLRKLNRDLQTTRSVEIPACGGFLLAERSVEHTQLFREGIEVELFGSDEELLQKCGYYLTHPEERMKIAKAARRRCLNNDYSYEAHLDAALRHFHDGRLRLAT